MKKSIVFLLVLMVTSVQVLLAQSKQIRGRVVDDKGEPIIGATVRVQGTNKGTVTGSFVGSLNPNRCSNDGNRYRCIG